jgi:putative transposase
MTQLYRIAGLSKQAHLKQVVGSSEQTTAEQSYLRAVIALRADHPGLGLKKIYSILSPIEIGRDAFIELASQAGLGLRRRPSYHRTTYSTKSHRFENLIAGTRINDINRVWVSDISYVLIGGRFYYMTLIMDLYSRRILSAVASESLRAEANIQALVQAYDVRGIERYTDLRHHSDRGTQYASDGYLALLEQRNLQCSMCRSVYDNTHSERLNATIKNEYLYRFGMESFTDFSRILSRSQQLYNSHRPHWSLDLRTPIAFEAWLLEHPLEEHPLMQIQPESARRAVG